MATPDWKDTALWKALQSRGEPAEQVCHYLRAWLTVVQLLLSSSGTEPSRFTLHDDQHSYRVAERMFESLPHKTISQLSDYELGLLLCSAYLHDIGMNPNQKIIQQISNALLTGKAPPEFADEAERLQNWLDESYPGTELPISSHETEVVRRLEQAEVLTAFYCRFRHNDWSEYYIRSEAKSKGHPPYTLWIDDLILLCKSHHFGELELKSSEFDLRIVRSGNKLVNLRFVAALLRVADVLGFDPERTPAVVMEHRNIPLESRIFWYKDHHIVLALESSPPRIVLTSRVGDAWTHRAVLDTADAVDAELQTCSAIGSRNGFLRGVKIGDTSYYDWMWPSRATRDTEPKANSFEYIEGGFRPDPKRILTLLAGTRLYHDPVVASRELLQNAFDAVREQVAHECAADVSRGIAYDLASRCALHQVSLSIVDVDGGSWLTCADTGTGMTRRIIEQYLLVSGAKPRPEVLELNRRCARTGIEFVRSGEFGIGLLSYFMIADEVVIETRPRPEVHQHAETHGWRFETAGLGSFGELRRIERDDWGSTVKLRLKPAFQNVEFAEQLYMLTYLMWSAGRLAILSSQ